MKLHIAGKMKIKNCKDRLKHQVKKRLTLKNRLHDIVNLLVFRFLEAFLSFLNMFSLGKAEFVRMVHISALMQASSHQKLSLSSQVNLVCLLLLQLNPFGDIGKR